MEGLVQDACFVQGAARLLCGRAGLYQSYSDRLMDLCEDRGFRLDRLGFAGDDPRYPFFAVYAGSQSSDVRVCFSAGIHGDEPAGPLAVLRFLSNYRASDFPGVSVLAFPVVNPYGFDNGLRVNGKGLDLNRRFLDNPLGGENKLIYDGIMAVQNRLSTPQANIKRFCAVLHTLHEDVDADDFYMYGYGSCASHFYRGIIDTARSYFQIDCRDSIAGDKASGGLILDDHPDGDLESRMAGEGVPFVMATETPGKARLDDRVECCYRIMDRVIRAALAKIA